MAWQWHNPAMHSTYRMERSGSWELGAAAKSQTARKQTHCKMQNQSEAGTGSANAADDDGARTV